LPRTHLFGQWVIEPCAWGQGPPGRARKEWIALPRTVRKLIGAVLLLVFVLFYALVAMTIGAARLPGTSAFVQTVYFAVAGLIWVIPAGLIIKWMQRPDPGEE
jgi:hypothetical protein